MMCAIENNSLLLRGPLSTQAQRLILDALTFRTGIASYLEPGLIDYGVTIVGRDVRA